MEAKDSTTMQRIQETRSKLEEAAFQEELAKFEAKHGIPACPDKHPDLPRRLNLTASSRLLEIKTPARTARTD